MRRLLLTTLILLSSVWGLSAHPHIFIDIKLEVKSSESVKVYWTFDLIESQNRLFYFDDDENGQLDSREVENLYNESFKNIKEYNYFITVAEDDKLYPVKEISDFEAELESDGRLTVSFNIDVPDTETYYITHFDTSYFIAFATPAKENIKADELYSAVYKDKSNPFYYDPNGGREEVLDTSKPQPGWLKAYPTRLYISRSPLDFPQERLENNSSFISKFWWILLPILLIVLFLVRFIRRRS